MSLFRIVMIFMCAAIVGCVPSKQAIQAMHSIEGAAINYDKNRDAIDDRLIDFYRTEMRARADRLAENSIKAEIKVVDGKEMVNPKNMQVIQSIRLAQYRTIEAHVVDMRKQIISTKRDHAAILEYSSAMRRYLENSSNTAEMLNRTSHDVLEAIEAFMESK